MCQNYHWLLPVTGCVSAVAVNPQQQWPLVTVVPIDVCGAACHTTNSLYAPRAEPGCAATLAKKPQRTAPSPCVFRRKRCARTHSLWTHLHEHLKRLNKGRVKCPASSIVCKNTEAFLVHCARDHKCCFKLSAQAKILQSSSSSAESQQIKSFRNHYEVHHKTS